MKVHIGPYKNWFGPYQLAEKLCFWAKKEKDEYGFEKTPDWVHDFGTFLAEGKWPKEESEDTKCFLNSDKEKDETWLYKFLLWIDSKKKRTIKVKIDRWDTWSMDHTLAYIILPMLKKLKEEKHGTPASLDPMDVPEYLRIVDNETDWSQQRDLFEGIPKCNPEHIYVREDQWNWIMGEMIFAFEMKLKDNWENDYASGDWDTYMSVCERKPDGSPKLYKMEYGPNHTYKMDYDKVQAVQERMDNGFRLFGKYYQNLWD